MLNQPQGRKGRHFLITSGFSLSLLLIVSLWTHILPGAGWAAEKRPRARDIGIRIGRMEPGKYNAITDVAGVLVGHVTLIRGEGKLKVGEGPVRTGVTVVLPRGGKEWTQRCFASTFQLNGNGEMTGIPWVEESGFLEGPILITNTHSVGLLRDAAISYAVEKTGNPFWVLPVVAETWDGVLNDINGMHVKKEHVYEALNNAHGGPVEEGSVGGGTGMVCYQFKGGIGTASRRLAARDGGHTVGVLVQANHGARHLLRIDGVPVGEEIKDLLPKTSGDGSIIIVVATDAPLVSTQLKRLARRAAMGLARTGSTASNGSGDLFIAFSTANQAPVKDDVLEFTIKMMPNGRMNPLFEATIEAVDEAIINALCAADTMTGRDGNTVYGMPLERVRTILAKYNRLRN